LCQETHVELIPSVYDSDTSTFCAAKPVFTSRVPFKSFDFLPSARLLVVASRPF